MLPKCGARSPNNAIAMNQACRQHLASAREFGRRFLCVNTLLIKLVCECVSASAVCAWDRLGYTLSVSSL